MHSLARVRVYLASTYVYMYGIYYPYNKTGFHADTRQSVRINPRMSLSREVPLGAHTAVLVIDAHAELADVAANTARFAATGMDHDAAVQEAWNSLYFEFV